MKFFRCGLMLFTLQFNYMRKSFALLVLAILTIFSAAVGASFFVHVSAQTQSASVPAAFIFLHDLHAGDSNSDVLQLQKILNRDPETVIAQNGSGSPGNETIFFGPATKLAVMRFQSKYSDTVLHPSGQTVANGYVGFWTRLKLNEISLKDLSTSTSAQQSMTNQSVQSAQTPTSVSQNNLRSKLTQMNQNGIALTALATSTELLISTPSTNAAPVGTNVAISGYGFSATTNTVNFGSAKISGSATSQGQIKFSVPNVATGRYDVSVTPGEGGNAGKTSTPIPFMVTVPGSAAPVIEKIDPAVAKFGQKIIIYGRNFAQTGNTVVTSLGPINGLSSADGTTLTFTIPLPDYLNIDVPQVRKTWFGEGDNLNWKIHARVVNQFGISRDTSADVFTLNI